MGGDPRNFNKLDLYKVPSPCFVIDKRALIKNLLILNHLKSQTGVKILIALKAFSTPYFGPIRPKSGPKLKNPEMQVGSKLV